MTNPPPITLTSLPENTVAQCDSALGNYMRAWDQIEIQLLPLFSGMLGMHQSVTHVLLRAGINQPTLRDMLSAIATFRLSKADQTKLAAIIRRWKSASTKRNRIVHGNWRLDIEMIKGPSGRRDHTKSVWVRFYDPSDPTILHKMMSERNEQKLTTAHRFTLENINNEADAVRNIAQEIQIFNGRFSVLPFVNPQPIDIDQSAIQTPKAENGD